MNKLGASHCDERWMKWKFVQAILPFMKKTMNSIKHGAGYREMIAKDVLQEIIAIGISGKNVDDALSHAHGLCAPNLDLKAKVSRHEEARVEVEEEVMERNSKDMKYSHAEHMDLAQRAFMKKWKSTSPSKPKVTNRVRTCYNCGNTNHFIAKFPYERVEYHIGRLVRKEMKPKSYPPRNSGKKNIIPTRVLLA
jgi:hypothetical protein